MKSIKAWDSFLKKGRVHKLRRITGFAIRGDLFRSLSGKGGGGERSSRIVGESSEKRAAKLVKSERDKNGGTIRTGVISAKETERARQKP